MNATPINGDLLLGAYEVLRPLGEGGMGRVFLGRHQRTGEQVVVKVMHRHLAEEPGARAAFKREMQVMKDFRHPHAVALLDGVLEDSGRPYLILEYVGGVTLDELLHKEGRLKPQRVWPLLNQLCQVLHVAHGAGILHGDLSARNLMVVPRDQRGPERIKVLDFGLARLGHSLFVSVERLTGESKGIGAGTPDYMCPEQIRGDIVDSRSDLYAVGVILYEMLTGRLPFVSAESTADILLAHVRTPPLSFAKRRVTDIPAGVEQVVQNCLAKYPSERPQSAHDLAERFGRALGFAPPSAKDFPALTAAAKPKKPHAGLQVDHFDAWMPEPVAVVKLRAFIEAVGGELITSEPGSLRVRLRDPRKPPEAQGFLAFLGIARRTLNTPGLLLELLMEKKQAGPRSLVEITVVLPPDPLGDKEPSKEEQLMRRGFAERICRELRAYLMIGR